MESLKKAFLLLFSSGKDMKRTEKKSTNEKGSAYFYYYINLLAMSATWSLALVGIRPGRKRRGGNKYDFFPERRFDVQLFEERNTN